MKNRQTRYCTPGNSFWKTVIDNIANIDSLSFTVFFFYFLATSPSIATAQPEKLICSSRATARSSSAWMKKQCEKRKTLLCTAGL